MTSIVPQGTDLIALLPLDVLGIAVFVVLLAIAFRRSHELTVILTLAGVRPSVPPMLSRALSSTAPGNRPSQTITIASAATTAASRPENAGILASVTGEPWNTFWIIQSA